MQGCTQRIHQCFVCGQFGSTDRIQQGMGQFVEVGVFKRFPLPVLSQDHFTFVADADHFLFIEDALFFWCGVSDDVVDVHQGELLRNSDHGTARKGVTPIVAVDLTAVKMPCNHLISLAYPSPSVPFTRASTIFWASASDSSSMMCWTIADTMPAICICFFRGSPT